MSLLLKCREKVWGVVGIKVCGISGNLVTFLIFSRHSGGKMSIKRIYG